MRIQTEQYYYYDYYIAKVTRAQRGISAVHFLFCNHSVNISAFNAFKFQIWFWFFFFVSLHRRKNNTGNCTWKKRAVCESLFFCIRIKWHRKQQYDIWYYSYYFKKKRSSRNGAEGKVNRARENKVESCLQASYRRYFFLLF